MVPPLVLDAAGPALLIGGLLFFLVGIALIILVEAAVLAVMKWASFVSSLLDSLAMNLISFVAGVALAAALGALQLDLTLDAVAFTVIFVAVAFLVSVLVEAAVLALVRRRAAGRTWRVVLAANVVSYVVVIGLLVLVSL